MGYAIQLLANILIQQGEPAERALAVAEAAIFAQVAAGLITVRTIEGVDRDAKVYELRGKGLTAEVIGVRMVMARSKVFEAIRRHSRRRRAVLRLVS
jgi:hypothetical protein